MRHRHEQLNTAGSVHFVTTVTVVRGRWFVEAETCEGLLRTFEQYRARTGVHCLGYALMPDHLHALLMQPEANGAVFKLMNQFKGYTSRFLRPQHYPGETLWQIGFDDVPVPGSDAAVTKLRYMHANPVRAGLVSSDVDYAWSSARAYASGEASIMEIRPIHALGTVGAPLRP